VLDTRLTLFNGAAGEDRAQVWLELAGAGVVLRTQEWGPGVECNFGFDTIESLTIGGLKLFTLPRRLRRQRPRAPAPRAAWPDVRIRDALKTE